MVDCQLRCVTCGRLCQEEEGEICPACGVEAGILDVEWDTGAIQGKLKKTPLGSGPMDIRRYQAFLPASFESLPPFVGGTPLIDAPRLARSIGVGELWIKDDGRNPSSSFKDRASAVAVARAQEEGATRLACASTGNAAVSLAACSAMTGLESVIFVPEKVPAGKLAQLLAYGARVFKVQATYAAAWELSMEACRFFGWYNRNCAVNPWLVEGKKTAGLEIAEQCIESPPDWVAVSVGDGCTVAGVCKGLRQMKEAGVIPWDCRVLGVQAEEVAPIFEAFYADTPPTGQSGKTYADSIDCPKPRNWKKAMLELRRSQGEVVTVSDAAIQEAVRLMGGLAGVFSEPAAAASLAGVVTAREKGLIGFGDKVVVINTGNGLKDVAGAMQAVGRPIPIPDSLEAVREKMEEGGR